MAKIEKEKGSKVTVWAEFKDTSGSPVDPTTVSLSIRDPEGTVTTPPPTNPSVGRYEHVLDLALEGTYWWKFTGQTPPDAAVVVKGTVDSVSKADF